MKKLKVICITMLICLLFSACGVQNVNPDDYLPSTPYPVTPTPTLEPSVSPSVSPSPSASAECVCRYGNVKSVQYNPIKACDENMDVPILVKDCMGRSLVVVWINDDIEYKDFNTHRNAIETVVAYLDISYEYLADDWIYSVLNVTEPGAVHIYVNDEELAKLKAWDNPDVKKVVNYVDVLDSQAYKKYGTLTLNVWHCGDDFEPVVLPK